MQLKLVPALDEAANSVQRVAFEDIEGLRSQIDELRTEVRALKLHLELVHDCKGRND